MQFQYPMDALERFELLRLVIGHTALANNMPHLIGLWAELEGRPGQLRQVLTEYQHQVARVANLVHKPSRPHPVMPTVEASKGLVRYVSTSGSTVFKVDLRQRTLTMTRPGTAIPIGRGERTAMAILTCFLGGGTEARDVGQFADPRPSARRFLTKQLGKALADELVAAYGEPHWRAWQIEYEVAKLEATLHGLRLRRTRLHVCLGLAEPDSP